MKPLQLVIICVLFFGATGSGILPQEGNPVPTIEDPIQEPSIQPVTSGKLNRINAPLAALGIMSPSTIVPEGGKIFVAFTGAREEAPVVSSCGDGATGLYLTVYEKNYDIVGQKIARNGYTVGGPFTILNGTGPTDYYINADVSCEFFRNRFIVVASHEAGTYQSLEAIAVKGTSSPGSELFGSAIVMRSSLSLDFKDPAIACNGDDKECLVVFTVGTTTDDVHAQRLADDSGGISTWGDGIVLGGDAAVNENKADVAWGGDHDSYLATWSVDYNNGTPSTADDYYRLVFSHLYDTDQGAGSETYHGPVWLTTSLPQDQLDSRIAYNRFNTLTPYWVVYTYNYNGDFSDFDIMAQGVNGTAAAVYDVTTGKAIAAYGDYQEGWADIAFAGGTENYDLDHPDQFLITFICEWAGNDFGALCGQVMESNPPYDLLGDYYQIARSGADRNIMNATVSGTIFNNRYLAVWDEQYAESSTDYDIFGSLLAPFGQYIPFVIK
jgi:hypothetical protein